MKPTVYWTKRVFDVVVSAVLLLLLLPLLAVLAVAIRSKLGPPVLFKQVRPGYKGRPFTIYKFRTMLEAYDPEGNPLPDEARLTKFGSFLRSSSLDELPELINVLQGEMSLVGPRPLIMEYLERYTLEQARRHDMLPGITGWAQINGRNAITWDEKFALDVYYVDNWSLWFDLKILWLTLIKVLRRDGISAEGHATMPEFMAASPPRSERKRDG